MEYNTSFTPPTQQSNKTSDSTASSSTRKNDMSIGQPKSKHKNNSRSCSNISKTVATPSSSSHGNSTKKPPNGGSLREGISTRRRNRESLSFNSAQDEFDSFVHSEPARKQNLNHLLNFKYASHTDTDNSREMQHTARHSQQHSTANSGRHRNPSLRFNREQYLQAQCQFVVGANVLPADAQIAAEKVTAVADLIDWSLVEQVHLTSTTEPQCPICLHAPVAAKMTRCGHVYCWPCMLHYFALSDNKWRQCPICFESIYEQDLRSAVVSKCAVFDVDDIVTLRLMCRQKDSLQVSQANAQQQQKASSRNGLPHMSDPETLRINSKLILADRQEVLSILQREKAELEHQRSTNGDDCPETMFIERALVIWQQRFATVSSMVRQNDRRQQLPAPIFEGGTAGAVEHAGKEPTHKDEDCYYFYQAADTQLMYLHSLNARMLQAQFCELQHAPTVISGRIVQKECFSMTDVLRKRLKYLQHLPIGSQFEVVQIELCCEGDNAIVSDVVIDMFRDDLDSRWRQRQRRENEENRRVLEIDALHERQASGIGMEYAGANIDMSSFGYPEYLGEEPPVSISTEHQKRNVNSFAQMLTSPQSPTRNTWPSLTSEIKGVVQLESKVLDTDNTSEIQKRMLHTNITDGGSDDVDNSLTPDLDLRSPSEPMCPSTGAVRKNIGSSKKKRRNTVLFTTNVRSFNAN